MKRSLTIILLYVALLFLPSLIGITHVRGTHLSSQSNNNRSVESGDPVDFPAAGPNCLKPGKVEVTWKSGNPIGPDNAEVQCVVLYSVCGKTIREETGVMRNSATACDSFFKRAEKKMELSVCCAQGACAPPKVKYTTEFTCDCDANGQDEQQHRKVFEVCGDPTWPKRNFRVTCQDWIAGIGHDTDWHIQDAGNAYVEMLDKTCPVLKCYRDWNECKSKAKDAYDKCALPEYLHITTDCMKTWGAAEVACRQTRDECLGDIKKNGPYPRPQGVPTPLPKATP